MKTYTLQRFYHEVKALIEKYGFPYPENYTLECSFDIVEYKSNEGVESPRLKVGILLKNKDKRNDINAEYVLFVYECASPEQALSQLEVLLAEKTGSKNIAINSVGVEQ